MNRREPLFQIKKLRHMRFAEAIITSRMRYAETFDPFVLEFFKYACAKALLRMPESKRGISPAKYKNP